MVQAVNGAKNFQEVLDIMVTRIAALIQAEACSIFLIDPHQHYRLAAAIGLAQIPAQPAPTIKFFEGLIGLVGERAEPLNLADAAQHPRYLALLATGEQCYKAFLGVPIIHQRQLVGVLAVQQRAPKKFDEEQEAILVTASAQLAGLINDAQAAGVIAKFTHSTSGRDYKLKGTGLAPGIAIGEAVITYIPAELDSVPDKSIKDIDSEVARFNLALLSTRNDIQRLHQRIANSLAKEEHFLFDAYLGILEGSTLKGQIEGLIREGHWAPWALRKIINQYIQRFAAIEDSYLSERGNDLKDLGRRILAYLQQEKIAVLNYPSATILVGEELSAANLAEVPPGQLKAVVSINSSVNSHVAILARALGIPAVTAVSGLPLDRLEGVQVVIDGYQGELYLAPNTATLNKYQHLAQEVQTLDAKLATLQSLPATTQDGVEIALYLNTGLATDQCTAADFGAQGVGLYRSEILFMLYHRFPSEQEQYQTYSKILQLFDPKPVTIRTLDIGGDKPLSYFPIKENNPALGWRGVRITLDHPEIFLIQIKAMLRANVGVNNLQILLPMLSSITELDTCLSMIQQAYNELAKVGTVCHYPKIGAMIEVPAAVYQAKAIALRVDFLSVGSNDLTQYILAVDRNNQHVANLYDSLHPAVISALYQVMQAATICNKPVSLCGEMAGDPVAVVLLLGLGIEILSMSANQIPKVKWVIRNFSKADAKDILTQVLAMDYTQDIRAYVEQALIKAGLGILVRSNQ